MSSAATLAVALEEHGSPRCCAGTWWTSASPLFANIHLCGSVLTEVFFVMTVSKVLYGELPSLPTMILFCFLLGVFAVGGARRARRHGDGLPGPDHQRSGLRQ